MMIRMLKKTGVYKNSYSMQYAKCDTKQLSLGLIIFT